MNILVELPFTESEFKTAQVEADRGNAAPLRHLCRKEVSAFEEAIRKHPEYVDGLVKIERLAVEGYLYQKLRGHVSSKDPPNHLPQAK